jgi:hypothetical protein
VSDAPVEVMLEMDSHEDKENQEVPSKEKTSPRPSYLQFEDFTHKPAGLETYTDGLKHPIEMRRILTGDLSTEMTVSYRDNTEETFRSLAYPKPQKRGVEIFDSTGLSVFNTASNSLYPKPPKLYNGSGPFSSFPIQQSSGWSDSSSMHGALSDSSTPSLNYMSAHSSYPMVGSISPRKPGRPPTAAGSFDPETGSIRYLCRLQCGASLASAKGRRKHEKKHCPNFGKIAPPYIKGQGLTKQQHAMALAMAQSGAGLNFNHSLFGGSSGAAHFQKMLVQERKVYDCRYCGKILKTYEGRRLHEKLQHVARMQTQATTYVEQADTEETVDTEDSKQFLIEHLKAAGLDPDILDDPNIEDTKKMLGYDKDKILGPDNEHEESHDMGDIGVPAIEYGDEDDDDDDEEEEDDTEDPSSDGIEIIRNTGYED